jgi:hypothetical protein
MPLDPRIPLGAQVAQIDSPLVALSRIAQFQQLRAQADERQAAAQEAAAKRARQAQIDQALQAAVSVDPKTGRMKIDRQRLPRDYEENHVPNARCHRRIPWSESGGRGASRHEFGSGARGRSERVQRSYDSYPPRLAGDGVE